VPGSAQIFDAFCHFQALFVIFGKIRGELGTALAMALRLPAMFMGLRLELDRCRT
jgi:hypothetical protein